MNSKSIEVYKTIIEPTIKKRHERVIAALNQLQPCTSLDVADHLGVPLHSISGRFTELSDPKEYGRPIIESVGEKRNKFGNKCTVWRIKKYDPVGQGSLFDW